MKKVSGDTKRLLPWIAIAIFVAAILSGQAQAYSLPKDYHAYWNVSAQNPSDIAIGYSVSSNATLLLLSSPQYASYEMGNATGSLYNRTISGRGIAAMNVSAGSYRIVLVARYSSIYFNLTFIKSPIGTLRFLNLSRRYSYGSFLSNYSSVDFGWVATAPIGIEIPNGYNFTPANSTYYSHYNWYQDRGAYSINFTPSVPTAMAFYVNETPSLVDPLYLLNGSRHYAIGVDSYGLYNVSGQLVPYQIITDEIEGNASIASLYAYNQSPPANTSAYGAGLQLNVVLKVESNGKNYSYWLQDVADFNTSSGQYFYSANIWNYSAPYANLSDSTFGGNGKINTVYQANGNKHVSFYSSAYPKYVRQRLSASYPLNLGLIIKVNYSFGVPVVHFGYGSYGGPSFYDDVVIHAPSDSAHLLVTPYYRTASKNYYDSGLVFCGEGNWEVAQFSNTRANLWMYYDANGVMKPFPSAYTFGSTGEGAIGLAALPNASRALVTAGQPDYASMLYSPES